MATAPIPLGHPAVDSPDLREAGITADGSLATEISIGKRSGPSVLVIAAYFLGLSSIAVIAVGGHFPWFTVGPATVLTLIAYFRHVEAKLERESAH